MKRLSALVLALILCFTAVTPSAYAASAARTSYLEEDLAANLKCLGLFKGVSDTDFDLDRAPTKTEALVMLIRLLGKENEVQNGDFKHPFSDVAPWADKYVGYAYKNGLANGVSGTKFGTGSAGACTYLTFMLRALGYSDTNGADFTWDNPFPLARKINILPDMVSIADFTRADAVLISYSALSAELKNSKHTLADRLIDAGAFTKQQFDTYYDAGAIESFQKETDLTAEQVYAKCAPAVFYLETYDSKGNKKNFGSGFFIGSDGTAVTNFHVISEAYSAKITLPDTGSVYDVLGVYDYDKDKDWAVIKVDGKDFNYLKTCGLESVKTGATVYAIGSPLGLQNTITQGIVSNPKRTVNGKTFIQTSAALNKGSSGGALINAQGEVIGITTGSFDMVSLNLALPVDCVKNFSKESVKTLLSITENPGSVIKSYSEYPDIPDFGAYYGVKLFNKNDSASGTTYYYTMSSLSAVGAWAGDTTAYPTYLKVLTEWGLKYITEFSAGLNYYWEFELQTDNGGFVVIVGTAVVSGTKCVFVQVIS